ncbi:Aspartyl-tRNA(Asn) amidotransferase subunit A @ Glutamyl-tRNA(Gln) amidotransferase subunit A [hydrothermal vent metagenome]|uniref:Aspartyl-tRNA(Asn) amidotransferase subunit A @ Glutamyl-tRNA(Gln) amidotransferase subunit A n=1 Tax=hydrothermal vent metagenome TaxID=652676 RepID=A0A3B1DKK7_9ZZZZ
MALNTLTAHEILDLIKEKKATSKEVHQSVLDQIKKSDKDVNAFVRLSQNQIDFERLADKPYPVSIAIKDNMCMLGEETTCASHILEGYKAPYDATVIKKLRDSGAMIIGNANMDEFAFGSSSESSYYGPVKNPWNLDCVPGGSSGGSTAAVAAHEAIWAIGSDTGGSIRQPASFCGVVGLKPTYGRVSRYGLIAFASSLDQIGPITKDVTDAASLLNIISGHDSMDSTSVDRPVPDYSKALVNDVKGLKIGIPKEYFIDGIDSEVKDTVTKAIEVLKDCGAIVEEVSLPHTKYAVATYYIVATAEASSNLARFDGVQYGLRSQPETKRKGILLDMYEETRDVGFGDEVKRRIMLGTYALSSGYYDAYYLRGLKVRTLIKQDFENVFKDFDAIVTPTAPTTAFKIGEKTTNPLDMYLSDIFTISANLSGIPGISIPCGFSQEGLPIGLQILGKAFDEEMLLRVAYTFEQNTDFHKKKTSL